MAAGPILPRVCARWATALGAFLRHALETSSRPAGGPWETATTLGNGRGDEAPRPREAGGRLQREGPRQGGRHGGRDRERQDVDEPLRRDRGRGSGTPEGERRGDGDRRGLRR